MKQLFRSLTPLVAACLLAAGVAGPAHAEGENYVVTLAFDASFDAEGKVTDLRPHEEAEHSAALWNNLKSRLGGMKLPPVKGDDGQPATFRTGLYVSLEVSKGSDGKGGQVRIKGLNPSPLVLVKDYYAPPKDVQKSAGWSGDVNAECLVGVDGRCGEVKVDALPGIPQSVLRWASSSMTLWRFQPPEINGKPIAAPVRQSFSMNTRDHMPVDFREKRKL
ncbi:hypothetical protein [Roseateles sp.]|uniref:energy transducer TonB n=1 Tax=Roseateles sp. TaxID=1971397 RepID=UPI0025E39F0F|nr:hypothetical protein [Roseateles sp.]MBV8033721.1 hypothetical protein [Roseateles sp.]